MWGQRGLGLMTAISAVRGRHGRGSCLFDVAGREGGSSFWSGLSLGIMRGVCGGPH